ncbi:MAG TPA: FAD-dependent oxidoreductase, partial [Desulfobacterales bacterium]|nr:FAD-dependent oxidoreductase [Desulfobacterales bacterium]
MPCRKADVAIVGGGLAGLAAADRLARCGARVVLLDDNAGLGGQYLRGGRAAGGGWDALKRHGLDTIDRLESAGVEIRRGAEVLGIEPGFELLAAQGGELSTVRCERVLLATGARERFMPFPGWTLPGVMSTGAAQILIKQSGILPARRTLVGGAGLFLNAVAGDIVKNGGRV